MYKFLAVLYGVSYFMVGLIVLVIGVWVGSIKRQFQAVNNILTYPALISVGAALIMIFTSAVGIIGGVKDKIALLRSFLFIIFIVIIIQLAVGIVTFLFREKVFITIDDQMENAIFMYLEDKELQLAFDSIQQRFECCGLSAPQNWEMNDNFTCSNYVSRMACSLPDSCCMRMKPECGVKARHHSPVKKQQEFLQERGFYTRGCRRPFLIWLEYNLEVLGASSLAFSILHIFGMFFVHMLVVQEEDRSQLFKYRSRYYT